MTLTEVALLLLSLAAEGLVLSSAKLVRFLGKKCGLNFGNCKLFLKSQFNKSNYWFSHNHGEAKKWRSVWRDPPLSLWEEEYEPATTS